MVTSHDDIAEKLEKFIRSRFRVLGTDPLFSHDVHLFDSGYVDSVGVVELLSFLEATFEIKVPEDFLFSDEFTTIDGISRIVAACRNGASSAPTNGHAVATAAIGNGLVSPLFPLKSDRDGQEVQEDHPAPIIHALQNAK
ncbi:MAG: hypothetical protein HYV04_08160 [Deltaproteobacteria bacterium]|nr:hypothetical protein [Deltaproteobacteria bacterium]